MSTEGLQIGAELRGDQHVLGAAVRGHRFPRWAHLRPHPHPNHGTTAAKLAESRALPLVDEGSRVCSLDASC